MSAVEEKWRKTGLLDGTAGIDAEILAHNLDESARLLITEAGYGRENDETYLDCKAAIFLPIVVTLFNTGIRVLDINKLYYNYTQWLATIPVDIILSALGEYDCVKGYLDYITTDDRVADFTL